MKRSSKGFTLIEILISLAIMGLLSLIVYSGLRTAVHAWQMGKSRLEHQQKLRFLYGKLIEELKSAYAYRVKHENTYRLAFIGENDYIEFISSSEPMVSLTTPGGMKKIEIYIDNESSTDEEGLVIKESVFNYGEDFFGEEFNEEEDSILYEIDPKAISISFRYFYYPSLRVYDMSGQLEGKWVDKWGGDYEELITEGDLSEEEQEYLTFLRYANLHLPVCVEVKITREDDEGNIIELPAFYVTMSEAAVVSINRR